MANKIYRRKDCELCGKTIYEKFLGDGNPVEFDYSGGIRLWEYSAFGHFVATDNGFEDADKDRIDISICVNCKKKIFDAIHLEMDRIKSKSR